MAGFRAPVITLLDLLAPRVLLSGGVAQRLGDVADRGLGPVGDDVRDLRRVLAPVQFVDVLDGLLAAVGLDVDVDVGGLAALGGEEALEHQPVVDGVDRGDLQRVTDRGVGRRAAALAEDAARAAEAGDVPDHQEVAGEVQLLDDRQLVLDLAVCLVLVRGATEALGRARVGQLAQVGHLGVPGRHGERRQVRGDQGERECQLLTQPFSVLDRAGPAGEARRHLRTAAQVLAGPRG